MSSLPNISSQYNAPTNFSFNGGNLTNHAGVLLVKELFQKLKLEHTISKFLITDDKRSYCKYSDAQIVLQLLYQHILGYGADSSCFHLQSDAYVSQLFETDNLASQPTLSRFLSRCNEETVEGLRKFNLDLVDYFLTFQSDNFPIIDVDSTHFTTYGNQEGSAYNAHYRKQGYHPLYAFEEKTGYCLNAQLRPGNVYCSNGADTFLQPILSKFKSSMFRMDSGFATPSIYDLLEDTENFYLTKLKKNNILSSLGEPSLPHPHQEELTILPQESYLENTYQAASWRKSRRVCQYAHRKEGELLYEVVSLVTNIPSGDSEEIFETYRKRGKAENFIKEMKIGFFADKMDSSSLNKNEIRMMISCIAYNLYQFLRNIAGTEFVSMGVKRFRQLFLSLAGRFVRTGRQTLLKISSLYIHQGLFVHIFNQIRNLDILLPDVNRPPDHLEIG